MTVEQPDGPTVDPVCGLEVVEEGAEQVELNGRTYWFCSISCRQLFEEDPDRYAVPSPAAVET